MPVIQMKCPGCGGNLEIAPDMENFACGYCGATLHAVRRGGTVSLLSDAISRVQVGTDRTAAELALVRLKAELAEINATLDAIGPRSKLRAELIPELVKVNRQIEENKALLDQPLRTIGSSAAASPKAEQSDAELMVDLGISFDGKWYRFGEYGKYHCDNLADAIRRVRQIR